MALIDLDMLIVQLQNLRLSAGPGCQVNMTVSGNVSPIRATTLSTEEREEGSVVVVDLLGS